MQHDARAARADRMTQRDGAAIAVQPGRVQRLERTAPWMERIEGGLDHIREVVVDDSLGLAHDFEEAMARHVEGYSCEWKGVLDDPDKLSRFVSFVNAPGTPDPTVSFGENNGRKVPVLLGTPAMPVSQK